MDEKSTKTLIRELTKETLESSSIHAIPNITKNRFYSIKLMWLICFLISSGFCFWLISESIMDYLNFDVVSKTQVNFETEMIFPVINICNMNSFKSEKISNILKRLFGDYPSLNRKFQSQVIAKSFVMNSSFVNQYLSSELIPSKTIINCFFNAKPCDLSQDFEYYFDFSYGFCFRFNSGRSLNGSKTERKYISQNGIGNGLQFDLLIANLARENDYIFSTDNGYNIIITDDPQSESLYKEGISVPAGFHTKISLDRFVMKRQPKPYSECISDLSKIDSYDSECYRKSYDPTRSYHYEDCRNLCFQKLLATECKCQHLVYRFSYDNELRSCFLDMNIIYNDTVCFYSSFLKFSKNLDYIKECDCPVECDKTYYQIVSSISDYPTRQMSKYLMNNSLVKAKFQNRSNDSISYDEIRETVAHISVFYDEMKQTILTEDVKTSISSLVSNIGGTLGLFLGINIITKRFYSYFYLNIIKFVFNL